MRRAVIVAEFIESEDGKRWGVRESHSAWQRSRRQGRYRRREARHPIQGHARARRRTADLGARGNQGLGVERVDMERREGDEELLLRRLHHSVSVGHDFGSIEGDLSERCRQSLRHRNRRMGKFRADSHHVGRGRHRHNRAGEVSHGTSEAFGRTTRENAGSAPC